MKRIFLAILLLAALLGASAAPATATEHQVTVANFSFTPANLTIQVGDTVTWTNTAGLHNVTAPGLFRCANGCDDDGGNGDPALAPWSFSRTFDSAAEINYACEVHVGIGMRGTLTVVDGSGLGLSISGTCPGAISISVTGGQPNGRAALLFGSGLGSDPVPAGPCAGVLTGLSNPKLLAPVSLDGMGNGMLNANAPGGACGKPLQAINPVGCATSNVVTVP